MYYRWQYQSVVEPLEPSLVVEQNLDWMPPTNLPPDGHPPLVQEGLWTGVLEVSLFTTQNLDWVQPIQQPPDGKPPLVQEGYFWTQLLESLYGPITMDKWFRATEQPLFDKEPLNVGPSWDGILEPTLFIPQNLSWLQQTNLPPDGKPPLVQVGWWDSVLNPDIFTVIPDMSLWYQPLQEPPDGKPPTYFLPSGESVKPVVIVNWTDIGPYRLQTDDHKRRLEATMRATAGELFVRVIQIDTGLEAGSVSTRSSTKDRYSSNIYMTHFTHELKAQYGKVEGLTTTGEIWGIALIS